MTLVLFCVMYSTEAIAFGRRTTNVSLRALVASSFTVFTPRRKPCM